MMCQLLPEYKMIYDPTQKIFNLTLLELENFQLIQSVKTIKKQKGVL